MTSEPNTVGTREASLGPSVEDKHEFTAAQTVNTGEPSLEQQQQESTPSIEASIGTDTQPSGVSNPQPASVSELIHRYEVSSNELGTQPSSRLDNQPASATVETDVPHCESDTQHSLSVSKLIHSYEVLSNELGTQPAAVSDTQPPSVSELTDASYTDESDEEINFYDTDRSEFRDVLDTSHYFSELLSQFYDCFEEEVETSEEIRELTEPIRRAAEHNDLPGVRRLIHSVPSVRIVDVLRAFTVAMVTSWVLYAAGAGGDLHLLLILLMRAYNPSDQQIFSGEQERLLRGVDAAAVRQLLAAGADVNTTNHHGRTLLWYASLRGREDLVSALIAGHADVDVQDNVWGSTALFVASENGHVSVVRALLQARARVDLPMTDGTTPLYMSCCYGHVSVARELLQAHASVNAASETGLTPIIMAFQFGHTEMIDLLLQYGADIDHLSVHNVTAFFTACMLCQDHLVTKYVTRERVNVTADLGHNPLHAAVYLSRSETLHYVRDMSFTLPLSDNEIHHMKLIKSKESVQWGDDPPNIDVKRLAVIKTLLPCIDDINARTKTADSAFLLACSQGFVEVASMLQASGADVTLPDFAGCSPLATSVVNDHLAMVTWLVNYTPCDVNATDDMGSTALYRACEHNRAQIVDYLISIGADVTLCNHDHVSPLGITCLTGAMDVFKILLKHKEKLCLDNKQEVYTALSMTINGDNIGIFTFLLQHHFDPNIVNKAGDNQLHVACSLNRFDFIDQILGRITNINSKNRRGETPLFLLITAFVANYSKRFSQSKLENTIDKFLSSGADINAADHKGFTALFYSCQHAALSVCDLLVSRGARADSLDILGRSVLHTAVTRLGLPPSHDTMDWILDHGVPVDGADLSGRTALSLAASLDRSDTMTYLIQKGANVLSNDKNRITPHHHLTQYPESFNTFLQLGTNDLLGDYMRFAHWNRTSAQIQEIINTESVHHTTLIYDAAKPQKLEAKKELSLADLMNWGEESQFDVAYCERLLKDHGHITSSPIAKGGPIKHLDSFMTEMSKAIDPLAAFTPVLAGSLSEGTKAMEPNEGDYIMLPENFPIEMFNLPDSHTLYVDFAKLKVKDDYLSKIDKPLQHLITDDGFLSRDEFFMHTYTHARNVFNNEGFLKDFPMFYRVHPSDVCPDDVTIRHLDLIYHDENYCWMPMDVDLVPAIDIPHWFPPWCRDHPFPKNILSQLGCRMIAKWVIEAEDEPTLFRISFEKCEQHLFRTMPAVLKDAYMLGKILKTLCPEVKEWFGGPGSFITSYHMKTTIFWMCQEYMSPENPEPPAAEPHVDQVVKFTCEMFRQLSESYKRQYLQNFWLPGENLLRNDKYGTHGWCGANYASLLHWRLQPGTDMPTFLKNAAQTQPEKRKYAQMEFMEFPRQVEQSTESQLEYTIPAKRAKTNV